MPTQPAASEAPNPRRQELIDLLDAGRFDAAFEVSMETEALQAGFELAGYTARADHDPATDFDAFIASFWRQVANMFDIRGSSRGPDA